MLEHLRELLGSAAADPGRRISALSMLSDAERRQVVDEWSGAGETFSVDEPLHRLFAAQAARNPSGVAVRFRDESLTYAELDRRANRLAHSLAARGVGPDVPVALCLERSAELMVAVMGVLKAGGAYVPLDPAYPAERLMYTLADSGAPVLVTMERHLASFGEPAAGVLCLDRDAAEMAAQPEHAPAVEVDVENLAYVIYTSGSTGRPKGVPMPHVQVARLLFATDHWFGFGAQDVWTLFHSYAFDFSVWEIWGALLYGGTLVVVPYETSRDPSAFRRLLSEERVTVLSQTPSAFRQLIAADVAAGDAAGELELRHVVFAGEALEPATLRPWVARHGDARPRLINMYGITETTVHVSYRPITREEVEGGAVSVIGGAIPDQRMYVLDPRGEPAPVGVPGEIYVGGAGLARGYLGRAELTAERFVPDPFSGRPGARLYRSGDRARWLTGGDMEYMGRIDFQVKVRGFRIELGEIEAALLAHPRVREAAVLVREDAPGDQRIVAYLVPRDGEAPQPAELRPFLKERLPDYMVPSAFVALDAFPLTTNGKLDRPALPAPVAEGANGESYVAPGTAMEREIAAVWAEVLDVERVGVHDNFFDLGGNSLLLLRVQARLRAALGREVPVVDLFRSPTVSLLAAACAAEEEPAPLAVVEERSEEREKGKQRLDVLLKRKQRTRL
jgi:amino acid adenylation domain-containing protein